MVGQVSVVGDILNAVGVVIRVKAKLADEVLEFLSDPFDEL